MKNLSSKSKEKLVDDLINISVTKEERRFSRVRNPKGADAGIGNFLLMLDVTANKETLYVPISAGSGRVSTGFVFQVEGTAKATSTSEISCKGDGIFKVTSGSILFAKVPAGKTATFKMQFEVKGPYGKDYRVVISRLNYKLSPNDLRYKKFLKEIVTSTLKFH